MAAFQNVLLFSIKKKNVTYHSNVWRQK